MTGPLSPRQATGRRLCVTTGRHDASPSGGVPRGPSGKSRSALFQGSGNDMCSTSDRTTHRRGVGLGLLAAALAGCRSSAVPSDGAPADAQSVTDVPSGGGADSGATGDAAGVGADVAASDGPAAEAGGRPDGGAAEPGGNTPAGKGL